MALKKCVICGKIINKGEDAIPYKSRYAHSNCFNIETTVLMKEKEKKLNKNKATSKGKVTGEANLIAKDGLDEETYKQKKQMFNYLSGKLNRDLETKDYAIISNQIKQYKFTYQNILYTMQYLYEILHKGDEDNNVIGLIPYYYDEAVKYYTTVYKTQDINNKKQLGNMYHNKVVRINPKRRYKPSIDITTIGDENDE